MTETLERLSFVDWCVVIGTICTVLLLIYAVLDRHWPKDRAVDADPRPRRRATPFILAIICWIVIGIDFADRRFFNSPPVPIIQEYGMLPTVGGFYANVNTGPLIQFKDSYKIMLIMRVNYIDVDRMSDKNIDKSKEYTITGSVTQLATILGQTYHMNISRTQNNMLDYSVAIIPEGVSPDLITSLSDVKRLGGRIVDNRGQGLGPMESHPIQPTQPTMK